MAKIKRKLKTPVVEPPQQQPDDDSGSDYEVDWHMTAPKKPKTVAEEFPLPKQVRKEVVSKERRGAQQTESSDEEDESDYDDDEDDVNLPTLTKAQIAEILSTIKNNKRLVLNVSNVNFSTSKEEIEEHFRKAGRVKSVRIPKKRASGFAFVEMLDAEGFQKAFLLHGSYLDGRQIRVQLSESGKKKSHQKILLLEKKNAEIRKMRKKNLTRSKEAKEVTLVPKVQPKVVERDPILDKKKTKPPTKKEIKAYKKNVSLKAKFRNVAMKGIKV